MPHSSGSPRVSGNRSVSGSRRGTRCTTSPFRRRTTRPRRGLPLEIFIVTAHTSTAGVFVTSEPDTGYSVDNLAPGKTGGFAGNEIESPHGLMLSWNVNAASDLRKYDVYRGEDELFVPDESNRIGTTDGTTLFDGTWAKAYEYFYKLVAVDVHGNKSPEALLRPEDINVGTMLQSFAASMSGSVVEISWTVSEAASDVQFVVLRAVAPGGTFEELAAPEIARDGLSFSLSDRSVEPGTTYRYRIDVADEAGSRTLFETEAISTPAMPLTLHQNHPNPFNPSTTIGYYLPVDCAGDARGVRLDGEAHREAARWGEGGARYALGCVAGARLER